MFTLFSYIVFNILPDEVRVVFDILVYYVRDSLLFWSVLFQVNFIIITHYHTSVTAFTSSCYKKVEKLKHAAHSVGMWMLAMYNKGKNVQCTLNM